MVVGIAVAGTIFTLAGVFTSTGDNPGPFRIVDPSFTGLSGCVMSGA